MKYLLKSKLKQVFLFCFILFSVISCVAILNPGYDEKKMVYRVSEHHNDPETLTVCLTLPEPIKNGNKELFTRGSLLGISPQIINVRCNEKIIPQGENQKWAIPEGCRKVYWDVKLTPSVLEISKQESVIVKSDPPWILLSEFSGLPRMEFGNYTSVIEFDLSLEKRIVAFLPKDNKNRQILPNVNQAPVFFVFGLDSRTNKSPSEISLTYMVDEKSARNEIDSFYPMHIKSIEYMHSLFGFSDDRDFKLNVVWIGLRKKGAIGGAAGYRTFLINYLFIDGKILKEKLIWSFMTAFHEQFHVIYNSEASQPAWAVESLAQYYAIKTLEKVGFDQNLLKPINAHFIQPSRKNEIGLKEANRRFESENDLSVYHLFYDQGASFWFELDSLIMDCTQGKKNLDDFIGKLSRMNFPEDNNLPKEFIDILNSTNINGIEYLMGKYL